MRTVLVHPAQRKLIRWVVAAALMVGGVAVSAQAAYADSGDGLAACNFGEICFRKDTYGADNMRKQFWFGANHGANGSHGAYKWFYVPGGYTTNEPVMDNAQYLRNRDTECTVWVWDIDPYGNWFTYAHQQAIATGFLRISTYNNGHSRCGAGPSYNPINL
jgi:hypothetical protein